MTEPTESPLLDAATAYALYAVSDAERADIERQVAEAPQSVAEAFDDEVLAVQETLAIMSAVTAAEPPAQLRAAVLGDAQPGRARDTRWRTILLAAAAVIVVGLAAFGAGIALRPSPAPTVAEQVLAAPDVQTVSTSLLRGGTATVVFSRGKGAAVLVLNNVPPPSPGSVYQMWLIGTHGPTSAGTMDAKEVAPSATAVISGLGRSDALAFTVEPGGGSPQPTGQIFAEVPLSQ
ncbi:MAG: anti-sigma factor [Mycobacterium sp.]|uniref:anti-sigma factor n=1 Tax=Mycobacterium sp. TaxID=1785 RepID=UPI003CC66D91